MAPTRELLLRDYADATREEAVELAAELEEVAWKIYMAARRGQLRPRDLQITAMALLLLRDDLDV